MGHGYAFKPLPWRLWNTETWEVIESGYNVDGDIVESFGGNWVTVAAPGMADPIQQWSSGRQKTVSLDLFFFAEHFYDEIVSKVNQIKRWAEIDSKLSPARVPRLLFDYGEAFQIPCKLDAVGALRWQGRLRDDGTPRVARVSLVLRRWVDSIQYVPTDPSARPSTTVYHTVKEGQTFEHVAARRYGPENAILGVLLRQDNPDMIPLLEGQTVEVPDLDKMTDRTIEGTFPLFSGTDSAETALEDHWDLRSDATEAPGSGDFPADAGQAELSVVFSVGA